MHPEREKLAAYVTGSLTESNADLVEGHLQSCPDCEATVNMLNDQSDTVIAALRQGQSKGPASEESNCQEMVEVIKCIGRDPSIASAQQAALAADAARLGNLREYKLLKKLGEGGMGTVYRALHTKLGKIVALKVLPTRLQSSAALARFEREMKAVSKLHHPNIVGAHDAGEANGTHFLVMELLDGEDLSSLVKRRGPLDLADACELVRQAAVGLQEAHEHGMVHRDIKPSNLMLTIERRKNSAAGIVKVLDMGLALLDDSLPGSGDLTDSGQLMGTINYMAPEQASNTHTVGIRADIYSLGVVLHELLTGKILLEAKRNEGVMARLTALATEPNRSIRELRPDLPRPLIALIDRMLSKQAANRPATPEEVATALEPFAAGHQIAELLDAAAQRTTLNMTKSVSNVSSDSMASTTLLPASSNRQGPPRSIAWTVAGAAALFLSLGVWIVIRDKDGKEVGRVELPKGGSITVEQGDKSKPPQTEQAAVKAEAAKPQANQFALHFDTAGKGSLLNFPGVKLTNADLLTIEGHVKMDNNAGDGKGLLFGVPYLIGVNRENGYWFTETPDAKNVEHSIKTMTWRTQSWQHVAIVRDAKEIRLYVDGVVQSSEAVAEPLAKLKKEDRVGGLHIGSRCRGVTIREVRVSSIARYKESFTPANRFETDANTIALYHLDEGQGDLVHDASGNGFDGRLYHDAEKWVRVDE